MRSARSDPVSRFDDEIVNTPHLIIEEDFLDVACFAIAGGDNASLRLSIVRNMTLYVMEDGASAGIAIVGNEGFIGIALFTLLDQPQTS